MIFEQPQALKKRIKAVGRHQGPGIPRIFEDTSEFMAIDSGHVLRLDGSDYLVTGHAREGRFGIDEQPKYWVKKVIDLTTGARKMVKLVFRETFTGHLGGQAFSCLRSPEKEAAVIRKVQGHPNFMQGKAVPDSAGNMVRILDFISGPSLYDALRRRNMSHEAYFVQVFPRIMALFLESIEAVVFLHSQGLHHGDIRADHIIIKADTDTYVWIDFDYEISCLNYDVFCLGNVLAQVVGKGRHSLNDIRLSPGNYPDAKLPLGPGDMSLMFRHRVVNLKQLFPYIPDALNRILMRFSVDAPHPYERADRLLSDLRCLYPAEKAPGTGR